MLVVVATATQAYGTFAAGVLGVAITVILVGIAVADLGTTPMSLREFARRAPSRKDLHSLIKTKVVIGVGVAGVISVGAALVGGQIGDATLFGATAIPLTGAVTAVSALFIVQSRGLPLVLGAVIGLVAGTITALIISWMSWPAPLVMLSLPVARLVEISVVLAATHADTETPGGHDFGASAIIREWPIAVQGLLQMLYQRSTIIVAAVVLGTIGVGMVTQGFTVIAALALVPSVLALAAFPRIVVAAEAEPGKALRSMAQYARLAVLVMAPFAAVLFFQPRILLELLYGNVSDPLAAFMRWGALSLLLAGPNSLISYLFIAFDRTTSLVKVSVITSLASATLVYVGAEVGGVAGVGWSLFASEVLTTVCFGVAWFSH
jgi:O-antigen/teichoic acid export membrane protein